MEHYIRQYMAEDWESISVLGEYSRGLEAVLQLVNTTLTAFPDLRLHILDSFCEGEDQMLRHLLSLLHFKHAFKHGLST